MKYNITDLIDFYSFKYAKFDIFGKTLDRMINKWLNAKLNIFDIDEIRICTSKNKELNCYLQFMFTKIEKSQFSYIFGKCLTHFQISDIFYNLLNNNKLEDGYIIITLSCVTDDKISPPKPSRPAPQNIIRSDGEYR